MRTLPQSLERGTVLQMDKAAPQNQTFLGNIGERSPYPNILYHNYLLPCSDSATRYETGAEYLRDPANPRNLAN